MPTVTIYHDDGSTETIPTTTSWSLAEELGEMWKQVIRVDRDLAQTVSLTRKRDEVELEGYKRGVLGNVDTGGEEWVLEVYSPEWYATLTEPIPGGTEAQGTDSDLFTDRINAVDEWTAGSIATLTGPMTFVFSHAFQHEAARQIEEKVPGELEYESDGTVNYVEDRGTDRTASVELSPSAGNLERDIKITERGRVLDATHVRVIGAHEGEAQRFATLVPDDDPATYENRVNYSTSRWSPGDPRDWDRWETKDTVAQDTIEEEAATLGEEITETYVEAEATVTGDDLNLGDWVSVVKPDANLDREMRVHRVVTKSIEDHPAGTVQEVILSTRTIAREGLNKTQRDIQRYNTAWQGASVAINVGPFRSAIDSGFPVSIPFRYPDLEFENTATLQIRGLQYRTDSRPLSHDHDVTIDIPDHTHDVDIDIPNHDHDVTINTTSTANTDHGISDDDVESNFTFVDSVSWTGVVDISPLESEAAIASVFASNTDAADPVYARISADFGQEYYPSSAGVPVASTSPGDTSGGSTIGGTGSITISAPQEHSEYSLQVLASGANVAGIIQAWGTHTHDISDTETSDGGGAFFTTETTSGGGSYFNTETSDTAAGSEAGIFTTGDTPSNVDVEINGNVVATDIGSGTFQTTVDVAGEFLNDTWNTIELTSDTLGVVQATLFIEGYDQIGAN